MDFKRLITTEEYSFLHTEERLGRHIILLGVSGSYGYGTEREGSDIDFRGVALNMPSDLIGLTSFEQYEDRHTDTVIYSFRKMVDMLTACNPNIIEMLGLDEDMYVIKTEPGQKLLDSRHLFLSRKAAFTFGHYADSQLRKLQNATARDSLPQSQREEHILRSVTHALEDFNRKAGLKNDTCTRVYIDKAVTEGMETEIFTDMHFDHYPLRKVGDLVNTIHAVVKDYDKAGRRNHKKDDRHLNKHAMHLIRLFMMGIDILEKGEIITHRPDTDLVLLKKIRDGGYMKDGIMTPDFYDIVSEYEQRFEEAERNSRLPDAPDMAAIEALTEEINRHAVLEDY
ncbi:MAG: nucleotidyltransferase domain-containing protein [Solobacterium sp.]|nr:nucleotidyltransferase domain-containing protein [Solobacterium sp.]